VDEIINDLVRVSIAMCKERRRKQCQKLIDHKVDDAILDALMGGGVKPGVAPSKTRAEFRDFLQSGFLDRQSVEIEVPQKEPEPPKGAAAGAHNVMIHFNKLGLGGASAADANVKKKTMTVENARPILQEVIAERMLDSEDVTKEAIRLVERDGIVFIDEIDKIVTSSNAVGRSSSDASAEGVQRDLLSLVEGSAVALKQGGQVNTDHILFIAAGAFHAVKPSDMLAELQGRLPIRVELESLTEDDMHRILTEPEANLIRQQVELLAADGVKLTFDAAAVRRIAAVSVQANRSLEDIGARRLHTVIERVVEEFSYEAPDMKEGTELLVDAAYVDKKVAKLLAAQDLTAHML
jgi:ATP-dependent HslUV protease ATP-binding subunit HslU